MLEVTFYRDDRDRCRGFAARGHADFSSRGTDIVCAAVSAVLQAARLGLTEYARLDVDASQGPGELELDWREDQSDLESVRAIAATAELAIDRIARRYPKHIRLKRAHIAQKVGGSASERVTRLADRRRIHNV
jgi:uncharacterized protein